MENIIFRIITYLTGILIVSLSITLLIGAGLGVGAWDALNVGLSKTIGLTIGNWVIIVGILLIIINSLLSMEKPDFPALLTIGIFGYIIDALVSILLPLQLKPIIKIFIFLLGTILLAFGISIYTDASFAMTPIDKLMFNVAKRTGFSLQVARTINEIMAFAFAIIFKGPIGIGTILIALLIGPLIQFFVTFKNKVFKNKKISFKISIILINLLVTLFLIFFIYLFLTK